MATPSAATQPAFPGSFWAAPLVPVAWAWTIGIVVDRHFAVEPLVSSVLVAVLLLLWSCLGRHNARVPLLLLWLAIAAAGMLRHHLAVGRIDADDVSQFLTEEPQPARLRGQIESEPVLVRGSQDPLRTFPAQDRVRFDLAVSACRQDGAWRTVSGLVQVSMPRGQVELHVGDVVEAAGQLARPPGRANPADFDFAEALRDQGVRALLSLPAASSGVTLVERGWPRSFFGWLGKLRAWGQDVLARSLPPEQVGVANALLLGDGSGMTGDDWEKYLRTGVLHVLAISGQHLVVLAMFLGSVFRALRVRLATRTLIITVLLFGYAFLTGGRPPVMRAAWAIAALCGGILLGRPVLPGNTFALAWLAVAMLHPTDVFNVGCQMSFLAVLVLLWGPGSWPATQAEPLDQLLEETRPLPVTVLLGVGRWLAWFYVVNLLVWVALVPLAAWRYHLVSPVAIVLGPPVVLFSSFALLAGFLLLVVAAIFWPLTIPLAWLTQWNLQACEYLVDLGTSVPGGHFFVADLPTGFVALFYAGLVAALTLPALRSRPAWTSLACGVWFVSACWQLWAAPVEGSYRCTFLAVGHGGCTVIETPGGRTLLYDAGALGGPDVTRRHIAPFLWQRGRYRIDDVMVSHADLDHFNGLPALLDRFAVEQVTLTPSFVERSSAGVRRTLKAVTRHGIPVRQVEAGQRWQWDEVSFAVLHPPSRGPEGPENARSLVLLIEHKGHATLLTGDLQDAGLDQVLATPARRVDVLMAPHHGSKTSNTPALASWAKPSVVVSCQRRPPGGPAAPNPYERLGIPFLGTWPHGAITIRAAPDGWQVETFRSKRTIFLK